MRTVSTVIEIATPVQTVWAHLTAVGEYGAWNPFITSFEGEVVTGSRAKIRIAPPGGRAMTFRPTITEVQHGQRLEWLGQLGVPGVFDGRHSFELEALGDGRTRLTQAEDFSGWLVPLMGSTFERTRAGFEAMNEALRLRAESTAPTKASL